MRISHAYVQKNTKNTPLNQLRVKKNLTTAEVAKRLGISSGSASMLLNRSEGHKLETIERLAKAFEMDVNTLIKVISGEMEVTTKTESNKAIPEPTDKKLRKNTFWNRIRNDFGLTVQEVAEGIGKPTARVMVGKFFTGELMPNDETIIAICNLFDVDFITGKDEFAKAHAEWEPESVTKGRKSKDLKDTKPAVGKKFVLDPSDFTGTPVEPETTEPAPVEPEVAPVEIKTSNLAKHDICRMIYGKLAYEDYETIKQYIGNNDHPDAVMEKIYSKVDYDTYNTVAILLECD